jgi:hypothetical protein
MPQKFNKPAPLKPATSDDLAKALIDGNLLEIADVLQRMGGLGPADCELLADHLIGEPSALFPFRFALVRRRRGRPAGDRLQKSHDDARIKQLFPLAYAKAGKFESAIKDVMDKTERSRTHVTDVLREEKSKSDSPVIL